MSNTGDSRGIGIRDRLRFGLGTAAVVTLLAALVHFLGEPLHEDGVGQGLFGYLNGLDHLLQLPGKVGRRALGAGGGLHPTTGHWAVGVALNGVFWLAVGFVLRGLGPRRRECLSAVPSRRAFLATGLRAVVGGGTAAGLGYALLAEPRWLAVTHRVISLPGLPPSLDGLRLVQITDIHHGPWLALSYVRHVVEVANGLRPDVVLLTGDYVYASPSYFRPVVEELARLRPVIGTVAVLGNHDWWEGAPTARREFAAAGLPLIDNGRRVVTPDRELAEDAKAGVALAAVGDLWMDRIDVTRALGGLPADMPRLLLSHNPDVAEEAAFKTCGLRVDLMVSGHTHGGQIWLPGLGTPIVPSSYGQKYAQGLVQGPTCPVFVCRGIGLSVLPLRLGVSPELAVLELRKTP